MRIFYVIINLFSYESFFPFLLSVKHCDSVSTGRIFFSLFSFLLNSLNLFEKRVSKNILLNKDMHTA